MIIPSFEEIKEVADSRYSLVVLVSKRARKIAKGSKVLISTQNEKPVSIAIEEIIDKSVIFGENMSDKEYELKINAEKSKKLEMLRKEKLKLVDAEAINEGTSYSEESMNEND